ncbi:recombinase family protein [Prescottella equi]|uniref:recombinase family protein n=1 Tax=Rhodococcus hoagii TaxID=43767 RepID=UPI001F193905|nr:recombinase family protein [Prescottella equi]
MSLAGRSQIWTETTSSATTTRPYLDDLFSHLREGDSLAVWRRDRLGRFPPHLLQLVADLDQRGIGFRSVAESITTTTGGKLISSIFGALAEFERNLIDERTFAGLVAAQARGRVGGRSPKKTKQAKLMRDNGMSQTET